MITTVEPNNLGKVKNIMLDSGHYLQWDPKKKEVVGFFVLFVDSDEKKEKFHSFPDVKELRSTGFNNFFKQLGNVCGG